MKELGLNPDLLPSKAALLTTTIHGLKNPNAISIKPVYAPDITAKAKALFQSALPPKSPECLVLMKEELVIAGTKSNFEATTSPTTAPPLLLRLTHLKLLIVERPD